MQEHMTERASVLDEASQLIHGDRNIQYGDPSVNFQRIADMWTVQLGPKLADGARITAEEVAALQVSTKLARLIEGGKRDHWVDIAGYAACGYEASKALLEDKDRQLREHLREDVFRMSKEQRKQLGLDEHEEATPLGSCDNCGKNRVRRLVDSTHRTMWCTQCIAEQTEKRHPTPEQLKARTPAKWWVDNRCDNCRLWSTAGKLYPVPSHQAMWCKPCVIDQNEVEQVFGSHESCSCAGYGNSCDACLEQSYGNEEYSVDQIHPDLDHARERREP